jgi:hypothetical protein
MEKFTIIAISVDSDYGNAFVIEGDDLYYFINERPENGGFDTVYPCPIGQVAGRFRHNWFLDNGEHSPVPEDLVNRIKKQQSNPDFQKLCEQQKRQFGKKRFEFD